MPKMWGRTTWLRQTHMVPSFAGAELERQSPDVPCKAPYMENISPHVTIIQGWAGVSTVRHMSSPPPPPPPLLTQLMH